MKTILFIPSNKSSITEFIFYAELIKKKSNYKSIILLTTELLLDCRVLLNEKNIDYHVSNKYKNNFFSFLEKIFLRISGSNKKLLYYVYLFLFYLRDYELSKIFKNYKIHCILIADDRTVANWYISACSIICKRLNIPIIIPPWANFSGKNRLIRHRMNNAKKFQVYDNIDEENILKTLQGNFAIYPEPVYKVLKKKNLVSINP